MRIGSTTSDGGQAMEILHILRSKPDSGTQKLVFDLSREAYAAVIELYETDNDWEDIVDALFRFKRVVCWW